MSAKVTHIHWDYKDNYLDMELTGHATQVMDLAHCIANDILSGEAWGFTIVRGDKSGLTMAWKIVAQHTNRASNAHA